MLPAVASPRQPILTRSSTVEGKSGLRKPRSCSLLLLISVLTNVVLAVGLVVLATRSRSSPAALPLSPCASSIDSKVVLPVASELIRCANNSLAAGCDGWSPTPSQWDVEFDFGRHGTVLMRAHRAWQPVYAERFWELSTNGYYIGTPLYRFNYRDPSTRFIVEFGVSLLPGVQRAWDDHRSVERATTSSASNTRGTVAFALDAVNCGETEGAADPCAPHRPACSAGDYCAYGGSTQIYVNLADNTHLDPRGFSPIAEVLGDGLAVLERIGERIGNLYGEVTELCPSQEELAALSSEGSLGNPYCILRNGTKQGVDPARLLEPDAEAYIEQKFAEIPRVRAVTVSNVHP